MADLWIGGMGRVAAVGAALQRLRPCGGVLAVRLTLFCLAIVRGWQHLPDARDARRQAPARIGPGAGNWREERRRACKPRSIAVVLG